MQYLLLPSFNIWNLMKIRFEIDYEVRNKYAFSIQWKKLYIKSTNLKNLKKIKRKEHKF